MAATMLILGGDRLGPYIARFGVRAVDAARRGLLSASVRGWSLMVERTRRAPPANPGGKGGGGAVNTGSFARAWRHGAIAEGEGGTAGGARIFNSSPYGAVIEHGRRAGTWPPRAAIARWAQRRLGLSEEDAQRAAFPIARAIARRGLLPRNIMSGAEPQLLKIMLREVSDQIARLR